MSDGMPHWAPPTDEQQQQYGQPFPQYGQQVPVGPDGKPPLWAPWYGIGFVDAVTRFFKKYARFDGRASRSEYWYWVLANAIVTIVLYGSFFVVLFATSPTTTVVDDNGFSSQVSGAPSPFAFVLLGLFGLWWLATIVPNLALVWRRMHDVNLPGALSLVSLVFWPVMVVFACLSPNPAGARFDRPEGVR
ncbi:uncharacterized membrane protein YhaH (DUF805 family) [Curtobacterium flaccumfaciens]|uniref:Uncharacterized membrane protein YhaH (DUF805 family) n=2 Tax=Curtobacterium flaccumfaciens TaxID=2035 RepID=A0A4R6DMI5_9MICO|nr:uncharacterized membrane protein YhaH (DUF805 family) [Curtobacterium flaccumfaciens]